MCTFSNNCCTELFPHHLAGLKEESYCKKVLGWRTMWHIDVHILKGTLEPSLMRPEWTPTFWLLSMVLNWSPSGQSRGGTGSQIILLSVVELPHPSHFLFILASSLLFVTLYKTKFLLNANGVTKFTFLL